MKAEEAALAERRKTAEKRVERLKDLLASSMLSVGRDKVETARTKIGFRKSTQVQIDDEGALPPDFVTTTVTTKPDKRQSRRRSRPDSPSPALSWSRIRTFRSSKEESA